MKKIYLVLFLFAISIFQKINAQFTIINDNKSLSGFPVFGNSIFLSSDVDSTLWTSDGSLVGTKQYAFNVKIDLDQGAGFLNNKIYFAGIDAAHGSELWVTDGTALGTQLVQDIIPGVKGSTPNDFFLFGNNLYFVDSTASGRELYKISGSNGAVSFFKDINPGAGNGFDDNSADFFSFNNLMYFTANDGTHGKELWVSDGNSGNTKMLKDITVGSGSTNFSEFSHLGNLVIFAVSTSDYSLDLWKTDGTNTSLIKSFNVPYSSFGAFGLLQFNNKIYFGGTDVTNGTELWSTDGNTASLVKDIYPGSDLGQPNSSVPRLFNAVFINNRFIFPATDANGTELWSSDGTAVNTKMIKDINPGSDDSDPTLFPVIDYSRILDGANLFDFYKRGTLLNGYIYFSADDGTNGIQLWKTNGTLAGTVPLPKIGNGSTGIDSYFYTTTGLFFSADDGSHGKEPWFTNGTTSAMVGDINPGIGSSDPDFDFVYKNNLYGTADNGNSLKNYTDLYRITTTVSVLPIQLVNFKATLQSDVVQLTWETATEINSSDFVIQRSIDGIHFSDIGTVTAAGNSTIEKSYVFNDEQYLEAGSNVLYYRLQLNDKDSKTSYSLVQTVKINAATTFLKTYPNPVHDQLSVLFGTASSKTAVLKISDVNGKQVYRQSYGTIQSARLQNINVSGFANGTYFIQLITDTGNKISKFVKQ